MVVTPGQLSVAIGLLKVTTGLHEVILPGQLVNTGAILSVAVTLNVHVAVFPLASLTVRVTTVIPVVITVPATGFCVTVGVTVQLSVTVGMVV